MEISVRNVRLNLALVNRIDLGKLTYCSLLFSLTVDLEALICSSWTSFSSVISRLLSLIFSIRMSSLTSALPELPAKGFIASISRFRRKFSSLYVCNCRFHSSTFAVDSCKALVNRLLLLLSVVSSISHFLALAQLHRTKRNLLQLF